jgi:hypothetical protein
MIKFNVDKDVAVRLLKKTWGITPLSNTEEELSKKKLSKEEIKEVTQLMKIANS